MIFLDTNIVIYLYSDYVKIPQIAKQMIEEHDCLISPMVRLELTYLYEIKRIKVPAETILSELYREIGLTIHNIAFDTLVLQAMKESWTRDPFDRLITAHAKTMKLQLITSDRHIQKHYKLSVWD